MTAGLQSNLIRRVVTALVALPTLILVLLFGPPPLPVCLVGAALLVGLVEFFALARAARFEPLPFVGILVATAFFLDVALPTLCGVPLWPAALVFFLTAALSVSPDLPAGIAGASLTLLGSAYLGVLGGTIGALLNQPPRSDGAFRLALLLGIVMCADTAAFFVGGFVGRHPLARALSPGKTVEGAVGGLVGGAFGALLIRHLVLPSLPLAHAALLGMLVAALSVCGDLFESLLKRWAGVKDSGNLFPGHGGMLDRLDSLLFGAPLLYYYFGSIR